MSTPVAPDTSQPATTSHENMTAGQDLGDDSCMGAQYHPKVPICFGTPKPKKKRDNENLDDSDCGNAQFRAGPKLMQADAQEQHLSPKAVELTEARAQSIQPNLRNAEVPQTEHTSNFPAFFAFGSAPQTQKPAEKQTNLRRLMRLPILGLGLHPTTSSLPSRRPRASLRSPQLQASLLEPLPQMGLPASKDVL